MLRLHYGFLISLFIPVLTDHDSFTSLFCQHVLILNKLILFQPLCQDNLSDTAASNSKHDLRVHTQLQTNKSATA